jgi:hypothetical protein
MTRGKAVARSGPSPRNHFGIGPEGGIRRIFSFEFFDCSASLFEPDYSINPVGMFAASLE